METLSAQRIEEASARLATLRRKHAQQPRAGKEMVGAIALSSN
jgi:hypothetical protein